MLSLLFFLLSSVDMLAKRVMEERGWEGRKRTMEFDVEHFQEVGRIRISRGTTEGNGRRGLGLETDCLRHQEIIASAAG